MKKLLTLSLGLVTLHVTSKCKITKVWTQHLISECTKGSRLTLQGLKLLTISLAVLFPATVTFAQAVSFSNATDSLTQGAHATSVAIADLNRDGKPDLAVANRFSDNVSILLGTGTGGFGAASTLPVGTTPSPLSLAVADLNGDGKPDLAVPSLQGGSVAILLGTGAGGFGAAAYFPAGIRPSSVAIGDLNADGKPDLATSHFFNDDISILLGTGSGAFGPAKGFTVGGRSFSVAIGDIDRDGKPDLAVANIDLDTVSILLGTGGGDFGSVTNFAVGTDPIFLAIADLNGDGEPDLAVANDGSKNVSILLGTGSGAFGAATNFPAGLIPASLAIGDLNGDGKPDLAVVTQNNAVSILLGTGTGTFGAAKDFAVGTHPYFVAIGDLNRDGKPDLAVTNRAANTVSILLNTSLCPSQPPVVTPAQAVQNLMITISNMGLPGGVAISLISPLGQASNLLNDNTPKNDKAACGKLNDFIKQVNARAQDRKLTPAQASQLLQAANGLKAGLGC